jgi:chromosome partitioning protein
VSELLGTSEVADLAGVSRQAVANWRVRNLGFPEPIVELQCGPVFWRSDVLSWLRATGR